MLNGNIMPTDDDDEDYKIVTRKDGYKRERERMSEMKNDREIKAD